MVLVGLLTGDYFVGLFGRRDAVGDFAGETFYSLVGGRRPRAVGLLLVVSRAC